MVETLERASAASRAAVADAADFYRANGFFLFRQALNPRLIEAVAKAEETIVRPYRGPLLRHNGKIASHDHRQGPPWDVQRRQSGLLDPQKLNEGPLKEFSKAVTQLLTSEDLFSCLNRLDGQERYTLH